VIALEMAVDLALSGELSPEEVVRQEMGSAEPRDVQGWIRQQGLDRMQLQKILLPREPVRSIEKTMGATEVVAQLLLDPTFQLK